MGKREISLDCKNPNKELGQRLPPGGSGHKVAGRRGKPIIGFYHSPARGSGRETRVFLGGGKKGHYVFMCLFAKAHSRIGRLGTHRGSAHGPGNCLQFKL